MTDQICIPGLEPGHEQHRQALPMAQQNMNHAASVCVLQQRE